MRALLSLFGQREPAPAANPVLPGIVSDAIDTASLVVRPNGADGEARVVCHFEGGQGFMFNDDSAAKVLARLFPELNARQRSMALQRIRTRVKACVLETRSTDTAQRPWKDRY